MKILIITGKLAGNLVKKQSSKSEHEVHVHVVNTPIAAFLTPKRIVGEIRKVGDGEKTYDLESFDMLLTPGLLRKDVAFVEEQTGIPTYKGPKDAADLGIVLELIEKLELSSKTPADKLIEDELRKRALQFIEDFEKNEKTREKLLKKPENILVGKLPVGEDFPMRVLAEIANAPLLTHEEFLERAQYFVKSGADMVDIGMVAGETLAEKIPGMVKLLKENLDVAVSIDSLNPTEIKAAVESGVDMVLSLDHGNCEEVLPLLQEKNIPAVVLPTDYSKNWVPETVEERVESLEKLREKCRGIDVIADLVLDPINSTSIVDSIIACRRFKSRNREPLFFGIGNVTELLDTDSVGVNALLSGIAMELGASVLFTPEESGKTVGSVKELAVSSKMMFLSKSRGSIPKDLGINLVVFKDKRRGENINEEIDVPVFEGKINERFVRDPSGSFKITVEDSAGERMIKAVHYIKMEPQMAIFGSTAKEIYDELLVRGLISRMEHAAYLGSELQKAEIALKTGKNYVQDFPLFKKFL
ncbi:dihydropteroate synthase-like protein [Methanobacterium aggregans]|uniref:dihydropteroate synthase-like protein n=1 Tax=Methanobacterium aggregans TaxID=1615586 RepID=UPI001AE89780|nr:dihydropteroate synthase-like protein [Methanobacterium aggregans]MBP2047030.1 dihydropteroate synthase-like protein [Methanobacterium aggregans]